jgi:hypothetical protein
VTDADLGTLRVLAHSWEMEAEGMQRRMLGDGPDIAVQMKVAGLKRCAAELRTELRRIAAGGPPAPAPR